MMKVLGNNPAWTYLLSEAFLNQGSDDIVLIDESSLETAEYDNSKSVVVSESLDPHSVVLTLKEKGIGHIVQAANPAFKEELLMSQRMIDGSGDFLNNPIENYMQFVKFSKAYRNWSFSNLSEKTQTLDELKDEVANAGGSEILCQSLLSIAGELFSNGLEADKSGLGKSALLEVGVSDEVVFLGCLDNCGTLNPMVIIDQLLHRYESGVMSEINLGEGTSGIGSFLMFEQSISFYLAVHEGQRTFVGCQIPMKLSPDEAIALSKSLHVLWLE